MWFYFLYSSLCIAVLRFICPDGYLVDSAESASFSPETIVCPVKSSSLPGGSSEAFKESDTSEGPLCSFSSSSDNVSLDASSAWSSSLSDCSSEAFKESDTSEEPLCSSSSSDNVSLDVSSAWFLLNKYASPASISCMAFSSVISLIWRRSSTEALLS